MSLITPLSKAVVMTYTATGGPTKISPSSDPHGVWGQHKTVLIQALDQDVTVYFSDPAGSPVPLTVKAGKSIGFDYSNTDIWINTTGTVEILAMG